jgi:TonB-dependent starch-binding outer membrane protein SusC
MKWISVLGLALALVLPRQAFTQATGTISGTVTGAAGRPLAGAAVAVAGTARAAQTDAEGRFTLTAVPTGSRTIRATFAGHAEGSRTAVVTAGQTTSVSIQLVPQAVELEGIVAVGYGTARRREVTGSVASVAVAELPAAATATVGQMLQGRVAGAQVTQNNGAPGGGIAIRIRGTSSISAASEPLYVIDGVPAFSGSNNNSANNNPLSAINPNDIESIEVLKDASSTSIYGARGAAGVVLVTTKRGRRGRDEVSLESNYGFQSPAKQIDMLNGPQFAAMVNEARTNLGRAPVYTAAQLADIQAAGPGTDWQSLVLRDAPMQSHTLSFSGGDEQTRYLLSGGYFDQKGTVLGSDFKRYSGRINLDRTLSKLLQVGTSLTVSNVDQNLQNTDNGLTSGAVMSALWFNPVVSPKNPDGTWLFNSPVTWPASNPLAIAEEDNNRQNSFNAVGNVFAEVSPLDGLRFRTSLGVTSAFNRSEFFAPRTSPSGAAASGSANISSVQALNLTNENIVTYQRSDVGPGNLDLTGGFTVQTNRTRTVGASNSQFANDLTGEYDLGSGTRPNGSSNYAEWALLSYLGRANYSLLDRYIFTVTGRADGSSRFGENRKWGFFPSAAFAWRMVDEPFMRDQGLFDELKLRLSYGVTGNQEIGLYQSLARLGTVAATWGGAPVVGFATQTSAPNPDLQWETTRQYNAGLDFGLLDNRLTGTLDAYHSVTEDLLLAVTLPASTGFSTQLKNVGSVRNDGVELSLTTVNFDRDLFQWSSTLTLAHNRNEVVDLGGAASLPVANQKGINGQTGSDVLVMRVGQPLGTFFGKKTDGLYQQGDACPLSVRRPGLDCVPGEYRYVDSNGDGRINTNDNVILGNGQPDLYGGLSNNIGLGRFELNGFFQFSYGAEIMNAAAINMKQVNTFSNNTVDALRRWTPTNTNTDVPRANADRPRELYDVHVEDGSFVRLQTLTLGYRVPESLIRGASSARLYVTGQNLKVWTDYTGFDPEVNSFGGDATAPGVDAGSYPKPRTVTLGVNLTF